MLKWDPETGKTTVVLKDLFFPNGVSFSKDYSFLVVAETGTGR